MYRIRTNQLKTMKATEKKYMHLNTYKTVCLFFYLFGSCSLFIGLFYKSGKFCDYRIRLMVLMLFTWAVAY